MATPDYSADTDTEKVPEEYDKSLWADDPANNPDRDSETPRRITKAQLFNNLA